MTSRAAASHDLRTVDETPGPGRRHKRASRSHQEPAPGSVHAVDPDDGGSLCPRYAAESLSPVDRSWDQWLALYQCRECVRRTSTSEDFRP